MKGTGTVIREKTKEHVYCYIVFSCCGKSVVDANHSIIGNGVEAENDRKRKMIGSEIIDRVRKYMYRKEKTIGERNIIRYELHTENSIFSTGKRNMGNKRFSGFVPNHRKWGEC